MELNFLGNKYITSNEPKEKPIVKLKYMGKALLGINERCLRWADGFYIPRCELLQVAVVDGADLMAAPNGVSERGVGRL